MWNTAAGAVEQRYPQPVFEIADMAADRRVGDEEFLRGEGEALIARRGLESAKRVQ